MKNKRMKMLSIFVLLAMITGSFGSAVAGQIPQASEDELPGPSAPADGTEQFVKVDGEVVDLNEPAAYIIQLADPAVASYKGGIEGLEATNPGVLGKTKLENNANTQAYVSYLQQTQDAFVNTVDKVLGRDVKVTYTYQHAFNGLAMMVTPLEAEKIAQLDGVRMVVRETIEQPLTDVGPEWIGAAGIWNGSEAPDGIGTQGEGVVVAILDTGINSLHPSFADVGQDGYDHTNPLGAGVYLGVCDSTNPDYQPAFVCNDKLIGVHDFIDGDGNDPNSPEDGDGHGSHTASTVAGNVVTATLYAPTTAMTDTISGVAPHANIIAYDVCRNGESSQGGGCPSTASLAAANQVVIDAAALPNGIAAINFSISGGTNPYADPVELAFLAATDAGVFVSASAGNNGPGAGTVAHVSPWVATVAASTHNRAVFNSVVNMTSDGAALADIQGVGFTDGYGPAKIVYAGDYPSSETTTPELCGVGDIDDYDSPWPPGTFSGEIVVCDRGTFGRVEKGANVLAAGAGGYILADNGSGIVSDPHVLPAVHISQADGDALKAWIAANTNTMGTITGFMLDYSPSNADIMAGFSSRGPVGVFDVLKPDVTAPGVSIWAAYVNDGSGPPDYTLLGGTSMSSPHNAGAATLMAALYPTWTPLQIKSALMLTADNVDNLKEDGVTPVDPFDVGAGRVQVNWAANTGFVLDETTENFENADPDLHNGNFDALRALNVASLSNDNCVGSCSWTRTVESVLAAPASYTATVDAPAGVVVSVSPMTFTLATGGSQELTITADVNGATLDEWAFASIAFESSAVEAISYDGTTVGSPDTWGRPFSVGDGTSGSCSISGTGSAVPYVVDEFSVTAAGAYDIVSAQNYDGYIHVYEGSFNPLDQCVDLIALNDDGGPGSQILGLALSSGTTYYLVTTGYANANVGDFTNTIGGPGTIAVTGEGSSAALVVAEAGMPVAVVRSAGNIPALLDVETHRDAGSNTYNDLQALEITDGQVAMYGPTQATLDVAMLAQDPTNGDPYDNLDDVFYTTFTVPANAKRMVAQIVAAEAPDADLFWGSGTLPSAATELGSSTTGTSAEYLSADDPAAGDYWVLVQNWSASSAGAVDAITLATAVVPETASGLATFDMPAAVPAGNPFSATLIWDLVGSMAGDHYYGAMDLGTDASNPDNLGRTDINIARLGDDVVKEASVLNALPGDVVTYTITIAANTGDTPLTYNITDTIPAGLTYVPGSVTGGATVTGNVLTWTGTQVPPVRDYLISTSLDDPLCAMPLANSGNYVDLQAFGFTTSAGITGNGAWQDATYGGGPYAFYGDDSGTDTGIALYFNGDGFVTLDIDSVLGGPYAQNSDLPDAALPNALLSMLWNSDIQIVYDAATNRGVTTGIQLTTGGVPSAKLLEFDDVELVGDPSSTMDFEMMIREAINDAAGGYEIVFAYDNLAGQFASGLITGTIGVENYAGNRGSVYAYNDANLATLEDGMAVCFDWNIPPVGEHVITYQVTVDADQTLGTELTNVVEHVNDAPYSKVESSEVTLFIGKLQLLFPLIFK